MTIDGKTRLYDEKGKKICGKVAIFSVEEEKLGSLEELKIGQRCMERVLRDFPSNKETGAINLIQPEIIARFFTYYYSEFSEAMLEYSVKNKDSTVLDMLSDNVEGNYTKDQIDNATKSFIGKYMQEVPIYSAVKVNGKKLYEYARNNMKIDLPSREVEIKDIDIIDDIIYKDGKIYFKIKCIVSKGTYIRSLIRDIGEKLGTVAVMKSLIRTRQGNFTLDDSFTLEDIQKGNYKLISIIDAFSEIAFKIKNGVIINDLFTEKMAFIFDENKNLLALYKNQNGKCRPYKMFI